MYYLVTLLILCFSSFVYLDKVYVNNCIDCTKVQYNMNTEVTLALKKRLSLQAHDIYKCQT